jgi:DNA-binding transcriptional LysR family regulator
MGMYRILFLLPRTSIRTPSRLCGAAGSYALQAAIIACHALAESAEATDWPRIAALYAQVAAGIDFYDAANGRPFEWEFRNEREVLPVKITSRLMVSDVGAMLSACEAGVGIAQIMQLGSKQILDSGGLVELFPDWPGELFPLYALYPSRQHRGGESARFC